MAHEYKLSASNLPRRVNWAGVFASLLFSLVLPQAGIGKEPVDCVDPNIGGVARLLKPTSPSVQMPHGMVGIVPQTTPLVVDRYLADKIFGFPAGGITLMATTGAVDTVPENTATQASHGRHSVASGRRCGFGLTMVPKVCPATTMAEQCLRTTS